MPEHEGEPLLTSIEQVPAEADALAREVLVEQAEHAEAQIVALATDLCVAGHNLDIEEGPACQECYDIACTVMDTPWLAAVRADAAELGRRATLDPGAFTKRGPDPSYGYPYGERLDQWQDRAIAAALAGERTR